MSNFANFLLWTASLTALLALLALREYSVWFDCFSLKVKAFLGDCTGVISSENVVASKTISITRINYVTDIVQLAALLVSRRCRSVVKLTCKSYLETIVIFLDLILFPSLLCGSGLWLIKNSRGTDHIQLIDQAMPCSDLFCSVWYPGSRSILKRNAQRIPEFQGFRAFEQHHL